VIGKVAQPMDEITKIQAQVAQVDKRIAEKKAQLMQLLRDPELAPYLAALRNGHQPPPSTQKPLTPPAGFKNGNGIRVSIEKLSLPNRFSNSHVEEGLTAANFRFGSDPKRAVRDAMYDLSHGDDASFRIVTRGRGGKPNIYERI
jgi:hypothetical protein